MGYAYEGLTQYLVTPNGSPENLFSLESSLTFEVNDCVILKFTFIHMGSYAYRLSELILVEKVDVEECN